MPLLTEKAQVGRIIYLDARKWKGVADRIRYLYLNVERYLDLDWFPICSILSVGEFMCVILPASLL